MKIELKERNKYSILDIETGVNDFRITVTNDGVLDIIKIDGTLEIHPKVSNHILIK